MSLETTVGLPRSALTAAYLGEAAGKADEQCLPDDVAADEHGDVSAEAVQVLTKTGEFPVCDGEGGDQE